jgi:hypothetical protein
MKSTYLVPLLIPVVLIGCSTSPISTNSAHAVPANRVLAPGYLKPTSNSGLIIVKRDSGFLGSGCSSHVLVDGHLVANLAAGEKVSLYLSLGDHIVGADPKGICGGGLSEVPVVARMNKTTTLRIRNGPNGYFTLQPTAM